jgi:hypothetical protein
LDVAPGVGADVASTRPDPAPIVEPSASAAVARSPRAAAPIWSTKVAPVAPVDASPNQSDPARGVPADDEEPASWRDDLVAWSRATRAGMHDLEAPVAPLIDTLLARFELAPSLQPVLALLYGAHLCGDRGVAPVEVACLLGRRWDEALGRGELAERGVAVYVDSRVALAASVQRMLDELSPTTGTLVGEPGPVALLGPCVVVGGDEPLATLAVVCLGRVGGAILVAHDAADRATLAFEARAYGAAAMLRTTFVDGASRDPTIVVVADAELADHLGVPRLS